MLYLTLLTLFLITIRIQTIMHTIYVVVLQFYISISIMMKVTVSFLVN